MKFMFKKIVLFVKTIWRFDPEEKGGIVAFFSYPLYAWVIYYLAGPDKDGSDYFNITALSFVFSLITWAGLICLLYACQHLMERYIGEYRIVQQEYAAKETKKNKDLQAEIEKLKKEIDSLR